MTGEGEVEPLRVGKPPPGLDKYERRDWREDEAQRIADLQDQARGGGFRAVKASAPRRASAVRVGGRGGKRIGRTGPGDSRRSPAGSESDRYVGAMILMVVIGVVIGLRVLFSGGSDEPVPPPAPAGPAVTIQISPSASVSMWGEAGSG